MSIRATAEMHIRPGVAIETVEDCARRMAARTEAQDQGTVAYNFYIDRGRRIVMAHEHYADSAEMIAHLGNLDPEAIGVLMASVEITDMRVYGDTSPELRALLAAFGNGQYFEHVCGYDHR